MSETVYLSIVVPIRNEEDTIRQTLESLVQQNFPKDRYEVIVVDGHSSDDTRNVVEKVIGEHPEVSIRLLDNPGKLSSRARNIGIRAARGRLIAAIDGHVHIPNDQLLAAMERLKEEHGALCLARPAPLLVPTLARGKAFWIAAARKCWLAHSRNSYIYSDYEGFVDPVSSGFAYDRCVFERVGDFDEDFDAAEDVEFHHRLKRAGIQAYTSPELTIYSYPRQTLAGLFRQMTRYGIGRARCLRKHPNSFTKELLIPPAIFLFFAGLPFVAAVACLIPLVGIACAALLLLYWLPVLAAGMAQAAKVRRILPGFYVAVTIWLIHMGVGYGFLKTIAASQTAREVDGRATRGFPVRVCFVIDNLGLAGTESQLLALINSIMHGGKVEPYLCVLDGASESSQSLEPKQCPVLRLGVWSLHHLSTLAKAWRFARFLRQNHIDVVHCFFPDSTRFAVPVARLAGVRRIVASRRNLGYWMSPWDRRLARLYRRWIDATVANCEACRRAVIEQEGVAPESVVVIPNGIDLGRFARIPAYAPSVNGSPRRVGMVANLRPVKAPDVFVRAAAIVAQSHPDVVFQIAGDGDTDSARRLARECGVEGRLELLGRVEDVPSFLAGLDVAVLSSHSEGQSNSVLEYMAAGRPIVATAVGGNAELIADHVHGLLVPPGQPQLLAESITRLLSDTKLAEDLAVAGRRVAHEQYSIEAAVRCYEDFYQRFVQ
jgi:L-malate glycosyltransferase